MTETITITDNDTAMGANPIDVPGFFVREHYLDFLNTKQLKRGSISGAAR